LKPSYIQRLLDNLLDKKDNDKVSDSMEHWQQFSTSLDENVKMLEDYLGTSEDILFSHFHIKLHHDEEIRAVLVTVDGMVDEKAQRNNILQPLLEPPLAQTANEDVEAIIKRLSVKQIQKEDNLVEAGKTVLKAHALLIIDGNPQGILMSVEDFDIRSIEEPDSEMIVRGPREGFIESLSVNLTLIRRRIAHPSLRFDTIEIGEYSQTKVAVAYVEDITDSAIIKQVKNRLNEVKIDATHNAGVVEQLIEDHPYSIFPTIGNTERPDRVASLLMEGRVALLVDGDPVCLVVPFLFVESIKNIEDDSSRPYYASFIRLIRFLAFGLSITLPAIYIAAVNFNKALIPSDMVVPLTVAREAVPFPLALEIIIMTLMFEVVREAGVRLPKQVGTAVSIVGPLILGDVAVTSSLVGAPTIIIVSISYIAAFVVVTMADVIALLRIFLFLAASIFGSYGLVVALLALFTHMATLTSFGVPYMAPFSPFYFRDWKDAIVRFPTRLIKKRPKSIPNKRSTKINSLPNVRDKQ